MYTSVEVVVLPSASVHRIRQSLQVLMGYFILTRDEADDLPHIAAACIEHVQSIANELDRPTMGFTVSPPLSKPC